MTSEKIIGTSLVLGLIIFASSITPGPDFSVVKPAMAAGTLTRVNIVPLTNLAFYDTTLEFFFRTATTGTIKTIEIVFPVVGAAIDVRNATLIERSGLEPGTISGSFDPTTGQPKLTYTITTPSSVTSNQNVRLEVAKIVFRVVDPLSATITTKGTTGNIIDGPTQSPKFNMKFLILTPPNAVSQNLTNQSIIN